MPERDWLNERVIWASAATVLVAMIAVAIALVLSAYASVHVASAYYQRNAEADRRQASEVVAQTCGDSEGVTFRFCVAEQLESYYRSQATNEDLRAQQDMALWALMVFLTSAAGVALTAIGIYLIWQTLKATQLAAEHTGQMLEDSRRTADASVRASIIAAEANAISRDSAERQLRAYLLVQGADDAEVRLVADQPIGVKLMIRNVGATPALEVTAAAGCCLRGGEWQEPDWSEPAVGSPRYVLMPTQEVALPISSAQGTPPWVPDSENVKKVHEGAQRIYFFAKISYFDNVADPKVRRHTYFQASIDFDALKVGRLKISPQGNAAT